MKTIRRDVLLKMAQRGELVAVRCYEYDDMHGGGCRVVNRKPVAIAPADWKDRKDGVFYVPERHFSGSCGTAYFNTPEQRLTVSLIVHSNCSYDFARADGRPFGDNGTKQHANKAGRPENAAMQVWLRERGIDCTPQLQRDGSMRGTWRLYNGALQWTDELREKLTALGFKNYDGEPLGQFSGNGGAFSVFVTAPIDVPPMPQKQEVA
jgi:hypothetical protein